jgi:glycosyltransferase involved in cell wall biosynthesis
MCAERSMVHLKPLVSIVTPCYNGEEFLDRYFQSVLDQTYHNLELIFVNDGSSDRTEQIALSYKEALEKRGIIFKYIYQSNGGQAKALNAGLKEVTGKYLIWPDSDDVMLPESVEKRVRFLEKNPEFAWVRSDVHVIDYDSREFLFAFVEEADKCHKDIFLDLILERTFCCGAYMIRTEALRAIYPDLQIYESRQGQNWQILIPMAGAHVCGYIDEPLFQYVIRQDSHSHQKRTLEECLERYDGLEDILRRGVAIAERSDRDYGRIIDIKRLKKLLRIYLEYGDGQNADQCYQKLRKEGELEDEDIRVYLSARHPGKYQLYKIGYWCEIVLRKISRVCFGKA